MCAHPLVIVHFDCLESKIMNNLPRLPGIFIGQWMSCGLLQLRLILPCGWIRVAAVSRPGGWIQVTTESSSSGWIQVTADSILWLTRVSAARYGLRLTPSNGWLEFRQLDTSYSWLYPTADSSSGGWNWLKADSILRLTTKILLILFCGWLESAGWTRLAADLLFFNISNKFKDLFCKQHLFYGLFSTDWFQLPLI